MNSLISFVIPSYNEERNVGVLFDEIQKAIGHEPFEIEFLFVDDGSSDNTWGAIEALAAKHSEVSGIRLSKNFGHSAALEAGLSNAQGDAVVMMDADLQHPPQIIPELINQWKSGAEIVNTRRLSTKNSNWLKTLTSRWFYALLNLLSDVKLEDGQADFRLVSRKALDVVNNLPESPKFYRGLFNWVGFKTELVDYVAEPRYSGKSSFSIAKMFQLARLGITSFSMKPLLVIFGIGAALVTISFTSILIMLVVKFTINYGYFSNISILIMFVVLVAGMLTVFQGVIAIYLVDIFTSSKNRPAYLISETVHKSKIST